MQVLVCLAEHAGQVVAKERLMRTVWPDTFVSDDVLTRCISELRRVFGDDAKEPRVIQTIPKSGYRLIADAVPAVPENRPRQRPTLMDATAPGESAWRPPSSSGCWSGAGRVRARRSRASPSSAPLRTVPLTSLPGQERAPAFSPDGNQVAFFWEGETGNEDIYVKLVDAGTPLRLTTSPVSDRNPAWSPEGRHIAFIRFSQSRERGVHHSGPGWSRAQDRRGQLGDRMGPVRCGSQLVSGREIPGRFRQNRATRVRQACSCCPSTVRQSASSRLRRPSPLAMLAPAISPDGQTVAFLRVTSGGVSDIYLVPFAGGEPRRLTFDAGMARARRLGS